MLLMSNDLCLLAFLLLTSNDLRLFGSIHRLLSGIHRPSARVSPNYPVPGHRHSVILKKKQAEMETKPSYNRNMSEDSNLSTNRRGKFFGGLIVVAVGGILLMRQMGVEIPYWVTSWPMIPIVVGLFIGVQTGFRDWGWMIPVVIGLVFLGDDFFPEVINPRYLWPLAIIFIGLIIMLGPTKKWKSKISGGAFKGSVGTDKTSEDVLDVAAIFGGIEKNIVTKNFKGGEAVAVFGGNSINLSQSDIQGEARLELVQVFGGTKLIVPANWKIKSEMASIFGGIEDKRSVNRDTTDESKVLFIEGVTIFGGLEIKSF